MKIFDHQNYIQKKPWSSSGWLVLYPSAALVQRNFTTRTTLLIKIAFIKRQARLHLIFFQFAQLLQKKTLATRFINEAVILILPTKISTMDAVQGKCYCYAKFHSLAIWMQNQLLKSSSLYSVHFVINFPVAFRMGPLARLTVVVLGQELNF